MNELAESLELALRRRIEFSQADFEMYDDGNVMAVRTLDKESSASESTEAWFPWKAYQPTWKGSGDPSDDWKFTWQIASGVVGDASGGPKRPTNANEEFVLNEVGDNWIWLEAEFAADLTITRLELNSGQKLAKGWYSESGTALHIVPIFHIKVELDDSADPDNAGIHYSSNPGPVQHAYRNMMGGKGLEQWSCALSRYRAFLSPPSS